MLDKARAEAVEVRGPVDHGFCRSIYMRDPNGYRRHAIERLGLPQVRNYRLAKLADEEQIWARELVSHEVALPDLTAVLMVRAAPADTLA